MSDHQRIAPEVAQAMMDAAAPCAADGENLARGYCAYDFTTRGCVCGYPVSLTSCGFHAANTRAAKAQRFMESAAPDLAHTVVLHAAEIAALRADLAAARVGMVTAEAHARAVREAWGRIAEWWDNDSTRTALIATLTATGIPEARAVALADGVTE